MDNQDLIQSIVNEITESLNLGYLSQEQVQIVSLRLKQKATYRQLAELFQLSCQNVLVHCIKRTCQLENWHHGMEGGGTSYLCKYDMQIFKDTISQAADENNCIPSMYAISLAYFLKKRRNFRAYALLTEMRCNELAQQFTETEMPSSTWINNAIQDSEFHIASAQQIEFARRQHCDVAKVYFYFEMHGCIMDRHPCLIINMDETMLTAKRRLKVLAKKGRLPLIPDTVKVPHITGCVAFTATGHVFDPLIILPNKKTLRSLEKFQDYAYFASSNAGWMTKNIFVYFCILLICQLSHYRLTLPDKLKNERFLLIVDGHKSRDNFLAALLLYLFNIDLLILPSHSSHLLQPFDIAVASPLKAYFKDDLILENCDLYLQGQDLTKQSARQLRCSLISAFLNAMRKSCTIKNIESGFKSSGIFPLNSDVPISSDYAIVHSSNSNLNCDTEDLLENHWLNSEEALGELFQRENGIQISEEDYNIELKKIVQDIKSSSLNSGLSLSDLPPLFIEDDECIHKVNLNQ